MLFQKESGKHFPIKHHGDKTSIYKYALLGIIRKFNLPEDFLDIKKYKKNK